MRVGTWAILLAVLTGSARGAHPQALVSVDEHGAVVAKIEREDWAQSKYAKMKARVDQYIAQSHDDPGLVEVPVPLPTAAFDNPVYHPFQPGLNDRRIPALPDQMVVKKIIAQRQRCDDILMNHLERRAAYNPCEWPVELWS